MELILPIAGIDDATKCPCIGSIFIAGVVADKATIALWETKGVKDSKLIARKKREKLAQLIQDTAQCYSIREITPEMIDNKSLNLNEWEMVVVCKLMRDLQKQHETFSTVYIDNWEVSEKLFIQRFKKLLHTSNRPLLRQLSLRFNRKKLRQLQLIPEHQADENHIIVGAASILAKVASDKQYDKYRKKYGNFGSGSPADPQTRLFVWQHRHNPLPIIRTSWQTFKTLSILENIEDDAIYGRIAAKKNGQAQDQ